MIVLGLDPGERRTGLAVSDPRGLTARPLAVIEHHSLKEDLARVGEVAARLKAGRIVVGLPLNMDGSLGPAARRARRFATALRRELGGEVELWDERLTTVEAEAARAGAGQTRDALDAVAAAVMLQDYLNAHRQAGEDEAALSQD